MAISKQQLTQLQSQGLHWVEPENIGLNRRGGAGPTDHKALNFGNQTSMIPVFNEPVNESPFSARLSSSGDKVFLYEHEQLIDEAEAPQTPKFYALSTADGIPYSHIATLHSNKVLATTVLQTCVRYRNRDTSCQFCAIEESLKAGSTIAQKTPQQLAEVAQAAVQLDGIEQLIMTTGTPAGSDRGAAVLSACARAVKSVVDIPIQAQCEPPAEDHWFERLKAAGVDALGMHLEAVSEPVRKTIMPGKASVPLSRYMSAYTAAVEVFGIGNVSTYILAGLGDSEEQIVAMSLRLIEMGVYPFVVPFVPVSGTPLERAARPEPAMLSRIYETLGPALVARGIESEKLAAGCAKCGACSSQQRYEERTLHG